MSQVHFQTELFSEIIGGLSKSFEDFSIGAELLIKAATDIYINSAKTSTDAAESAEQSSEILQTDFFVKSHEMREVHCMGIIECKSCGYEHGKFIGEKMNFCPGCGKAIRR
jgi:hypothetical protein